MKYPLVFFSLIFSLFLGAQEATNQLRTQLEMNQGEVEDALSIGLLGEELEDLKRSPININFASAEELAQIPWLDIFQISNLILYREETGMIFSAYELTVVKGFDRALIQTLLPFLDFTTENGLPSISWRDVKRSRHELILRYEQTLQKRAGYRSGISNPYLGAPFGSYLRYRGKLKDHILIGLSVQKDPGEPLNPTVNPMLADHISTFIAFKNFGPVQYFIAGDYQVSFAQGLALWSGGGLGGPGRFSRVKRYGNGISPYAGAEETRYFRGSAIKLKLLASLELQGFISGKPQDARVETDSLNQPIGTSAALITTGLHRTESEINNKNSNYLRSWGGQLKWYRKNLSLAFSSVTYQFRNPIPSAQDLNNKYRFSGRKLSNHSVEANLFWRKYNFFTEVATDHRGHWAGIAGVESLLSDGFHLSLAVRSSHLKYQSFYVSLPAQTSGSGEQGLYLGIDWEMSPKCKLHLSADQYHLPWLSYRTDAPLFGHSITTQLEFSLRRYLNLQFLMRVRDDQQNQSGSGPFKLLGKRRRINLRADMRYQLNSRWWLAWRIEKSRVETDSRVEGMLIYQDLGWAVEKMNLEIKARLALIDAPDYSTRIYAYEADLLYRFSIPAYYGQAFRSYLLIKWQTSENISIQGKLSLSSFFDRETISSGLQEINGNNISNLAVQVRIKI